MSLSAAICSAVSALNCQSSALATISTNLANSSTTGYKASDTSFSSLLAGDASSGTATGGVTSSSVTNISENGLLVDSSVSTYMAISGNGLFAVAGSSDSDDVSYTRNGEFSVDADGYLVNNGSYLQGWATDASGEITGGANSSNLVSIDTDEISSLASATTEVSMVANLPAESEVGDAYTSSMEVYDSLGTAAITTVTWEKTAANEWTATFSDPVLSSDASQTIGTVSSGAITINFNEDGTLASTSSTTLSISNWTTGGADGDVTLDLGSSGTSGGLSQYSSGAESLEVTLESNQDGVAFGSLTGISIEDDGTVYANFSNGMQRSIYKVAVATFANNNGLTAQSGGIYDASSTSGSATYKLSGENGAGSIFGGQIESSTTDTNTEFSRMMEAQQAYSSAAQAISTANDMFDTLISAVR